MTISCSNLLNPLAQSNSAAPVVLPSLNYTNQDFASLKTRLALYLEQRFGDKFTNFFESDLGVVLMEMWVFCADMLSFKGDQLANEIYIDSVGELDNAFRISKSVGFQPTPPIAARALFSATINATLQTNLVIPSGFQIETSTGQSALTYELFPADPLNNPIFDQDIIIPSGSFSNTSIVGLEGQTFQDVITSTGDVNQVFTLAQNPVIYDSIRVDVDGTRWTQVDFFTDSQPRQEYRVDFDSSYNGFVIFGNSQAGAIPSQGSQVVVTYRVGGGSRGNIITGAINTQSGFIAPGISITVPVQFINYTKGDFGYDGDSIDDIRRKLPAFNKVQDRAVTGEDYKSLAELFVSGYNGQIGKATAALRNYGCAGNVIDLFVLARSGADGLTEANDQMKIELGEYMEEKKMITDFLCIKDGVVVLVDTLVDLHVPKFYRKFATEITARATQRINNFFNLANWEYGKSLRAIELTQSLADIREITSVDVSFTADDPAQTGDIVNPKYYEIIRQDNLNVVLTFE
jgi:hypothetical protein